VSSPDLIDPIRMASRHLVRELGFMEESLAETSMSPSAVHALLEIGARGTLTASELSELLCLEKSSVSRMLRKLVKGGDVKEQPGEADGRTKTLHLTEKGQAVEAGIHHFARRQVAEALRHLRPEQRRIVLDGLRLYAGALRALKKADPADVSPVLIKTGYQPGVVARCIEMHALYYARTSGFGCAFEAAVAGGLAEFVKRLDKRCNQLWWATQAGHVVGMIAIDGEDMGQDCAHLRWFIVEDGMRGTGIGRELLSEAISFCNNKGFKETQLWTFRGLDAARRLYEKQGFALAEERLGCQWGEEVMEQRFVRRMA
jgi:DNA-binding MarR family transcriptional regulator/GNAT superfamily N-acetyltransferase